MTPYDTLERVATHALKLYQRNARTHSGYCDVIARRFERFVGKPAVLEATGESFEATAAARGLSKEARNG